MASTPSGVTYLKSSPVQGLRRILRDQYSVPSILSELVQNADDAGAECLHFAMLSDWPPDVHPLLTGPTLMILNDGLFRPVDKDGIARLDEGAKGGEVGAIGKYGLGMKSLFHLCEAVFFAANHEGSKKSESVSLLSPWEEGGPHDDWQDMERSQSVIVDLIDRWQHGAERWFCLLVPLRRQEHLAGAEAIVQAPFPKAEAVRARLDLSSLVSLLPLLRTVREMTVWEGSFADGFAQLERAVVDDRPSPQRRAYGSPSKPLSAGDKRVLVLSVSDRSAEGGRMLLASGIEWLLDDPGFQTMKADSRWPMNYTWDTKRGRLQLQEKGEPHCAVVLTHRPGAERCLSIVNTVYLPLSDGQKASVGGPFEGAYDLLLHGQFFLDAGRHDLYSGGDEGDIQRQWNQRLLRDGVLPLIPRALAEFVERWEPGAAEITAVTKALQQNDFFAWYRRDICSAYWWVAPLDAAEGEIPWRLVEQPQRYFTFPPLEGRRSLGHQLFGALSDICSQELVVEADAPLLSGGPPTRWNEDGELLASLLDSVDPNLLAAPDALALVTELLREEAPLPPQADARISRNLRTAITNLGIPAFERAGGAFTSFLEVIAGSWVAIGPIETEALPQFRELNGLELSVALVPSHLAPTTRPFGEGHGVPLDDAATIFRWLESTADQRPLERTSALALRTWEATDAQGHKKRETLGSISVWLARGGPDSGDTCHDWKALAQLKEKGRLFGSGSPLLNSLQKSLDGTALYSLYAPRGANAFQILFGSSENSTCDADACITFLTAHPPPTLSKPANRVELLERLKATGPDSNRKPGAIRYLLHGNPEQIQNLETPLLTTPGGRDGHLALVAEVALRQLNAAWRWVPDDLWRCLTRNEQETYRLTEVDRREVEILLRSAGTAWVREVPLSDEDRVSLLVDIEDPEVWWNLPLHKTTLGGYVGLDRSTTFLASLYDGAPGIQAHATLIQARGHPALERRYEREGIEPWSPTAAIGIAVARKHPSRFCLEILDALSDERDGPISSRMLGLLRSEAWLTTAEGKAVRPEDVIVIEGMDDEAQRLLADEALAGAFTTLDDLHAAVKKHPAVGRLRSLKILPDRRASLEVLAMCLAEVPAYRTGPLAGLPEGPATLRTLLTAFSGVPNHVLPAIPILSKLVDAFDGDHQVVAERVLANIREELPVELVTSCVKSLGEAIAADQNPRPERLQVLASHVDALVRRGGREALAGLELPNRHGKLVPTSRLCRDEKGIDPSSLVDPLLVGCLQERRSPSDTVEETDLDHARFDSSILIDYMRDWENLVPRGQLGALLALFGDDEEIKRAADAFLNPRSLDGVRAQLGWRPTALGKDVDESVAESMERQRFAFRIADQDSTVRVPNLLGEWFSAPVGGDVDSIFVGSLWSQPPQKYRLPDKRTRVVTLRIFEPRDLTRTRRSEVLRNSARILLNDVYAQRHDLSSWWSELEEGGQLALDITQAQLLHSAWFYFQQLGDRQLAGLETILREYETLTDQRVELQSGGKAPARKLQEIQGRLDALPSALRAMLTDDAEVQAAVLGRIRAKLSDYQYSASSVMLELFQNADDAAAELADMLGDQTPQKSRSMEVVLRSGIVRVRHWGRPINAFARGQFPPKTGRDRGYDKDLKKMLILNSSDKGERAELVTGKFGLGFKSVFFLTDRPQVASGDLAFEVRGGFFPVPLSPDMSSQLRADAGGSSDASWEATTIHLPLRPVAQSDADGAVEEFAALIPLLLTFSRHIQRCSIQHGEVLSDAALHKALVVDGSSSSVSVAHTPRMPGSSPLWGTRFLVLRSPSFTMALALGSEGLKPLPESVPVLWAGAPTRAPRGTSFCLNGPFELDVGRNQLAESPENHSIFRSFGREMGDTLVLLYDAAESPNVLGGAVPSLPDIPATPFWTSLWRVLAAPEVRKDTLLRSLFWDQEGMMAQLVASRPVLPTHLPEPFDNLTSSEFVQGVVTGILDRDDELAQVVLSWPAVTDRWSPGHLVSSRRTWDLVAGDGEDRIGTLGIVDAVREVVGPSGEVRPEEARLLGTAIRRDRIERWQESNENMMELSELRLYLTSLRFLTSADQKAMSADLIATEMGGDEHRRAAFAPSEHLLDSSYEADAVEFFAVCRREINADAGLLAEWARRATTEEARRGVITYLLKGDLNTSMAEQIRAGSSHNWLADIPEELLRGLEEDERIRVCALVARDSRSFQESWSSPTRHRAAGEGALERIYNWWRENREEQLRVFQRKVYPDGRFVRISAMPPHDDDGRIEWLKLFLLSALQTMGQARPEQHRDFIEKCDREGWLHAFSVAREKPARWVEVFLQYVDGQDSELTYYRHMKDLVGLGIIARYIDEYIEAILAADRAKGPVSPRDLLAPRVSSLFQGGGADAPPIHSVLGIGQCFLFRELLRHGILKKRHLQPYCYVPFRRTRSVLERLGCTGLEAEPDRLTRSRMIHVFLTERLGERASFQDGFDIPFTILADDTSLADRLMLGG